MISMSSNSVNRIWPVAHRIHAPTYQVGIIYNSFGRIMSIIFYIIVVVRSNNSKGAYIYRYVAHKYILINIIVVVVVVFRRRRV